MSQPLRFPNTPARPYPNQQGYMVSFAQLYFAAVCIVLYLNSHSHHVPVPPTLLFLIL